MNTLRPRRQRVLKPKLALKLRLRAPMRNLQHGRRPRLVLLNCKRALPSWRRAMGREPIRRPASPQRMTGRAMPEAGTLPYWWHLA